MHNQNSTHTKVHVCCALIAIAHILCHVHAWKMAAKAEDDVGDIPGSSGLLPALTTISIFGSFRGLH